MNKLGLVLGVAAVAAIAGCKDPNYSKHKKNVQNEVQPVSTQTVDAQDPKAVDVVAPEKDMQVFDTPAVPQCKCPAGTVHKEACACGAADCQCIVEIPAPVVTKVDPVAPVAAEVTTPYIVQRGDYLAKISKKYNITIAAIKRVNPNMKGDVVRVGQTIQLPGKVEVGEQTKPVVAPVAKPAKVYTPYTGATKDYKIQNGDSLGLIAKKNGISVRQLKELNGLSSDVIRVGKTLKVPAAKVVAEAAAVAKAQPAKVEKKVAPAVAPVVEPVPAADTTVAEPVVPAAVDTAAPAVEETLPTVDATAPVADVAPAPKAAEDGPTHVVREGEDLTTLSILYSLSPSEIRSFNNLGENDELKPGQVIKLPADTQL